MAREATIESLHSQCAITAATRNTDNERNGHDGWKKLVKKNRQRSSSSLAGISSVTYSSTRGQFRRSSSLSLYEEMVDDTPSLEQYSLEQGSVCSSLADSRNLNAVKIQNDEEAGLASLKSQSRMSKGIRLRKVISSIEKRSDGDTVRAAAKVAYSRLGHFFPSEEDELSFTSADHIISSQHKIKKRDERRSHSRKGKCHSNTTSLLSYKYQPKQFQDIAGNEIVVKAISNAVQRKKVAPLYLFHGPSGTGKTCTARIFAMALNCESKSRVKPCWSCSGCSTSLEHCSGNKIFGNIESTTFTQAILGFKVFIIDECHSLSKEAWNQLLGIVERGYYEYDSSSVLVFVMITDDANKVPQFILSRCQKFCFTKLKDMDITFKLARIVAREDIAIEREALKLIVTKAQGSLREAENILDQLVLLGSRIKCSMVQQLVGLVPHTKLIDLLATAISADTIRTIRLTRELIACGAQPQALVSQLASLITDILSGSFGDASSSSSARISRLLNTESEKLCHALKVLVDTEKQLRLSTDDHITWVVAALLHIASADVSDRSISNGIVLPRGLILPSEDKPDLELLDINRSGLYSLIHHRESRRYDNSIDPTSEQPRDIIANDPSTTGRSNDKTGKCRGKTVEKGPNLASLGDMDEIWHNILERIQSEYLKELLFSQAKLASLTVSSANAIVHLMFKRPEDKQAAQISEESISEAMEQAIGCRVTVNMSLEPMQQLGIIESNRVSTSKRQVEDYCNSAHQHGRNPFLPESELSHGLNGVAMYHGSFPPNLSQVQNRGQETSTASRSVPQQTLPFLGHYLTQESLLSASADNETNLSKEDQASMEPTYIPKNTKPKHRWPSLSLIQQGDASIEPYSQDLLFENANRDRTRIARRNSKFREDFSKPTEDCHVKTRATRIGLNSSWSCTDILCQRNIKVS